LKGSSVVRCHHLLKTFHTGWTVRQHPDGTIVWTTPTGRIHTTTSAGARFFPQLAAPTETLMPPHHNSDSQALHRVLRRYRHMSIPPYEPPKSAPSPGAGNMLLCPKCAGVMKTYERNGIHLEQCDTCRGIFLDFGELEALTQMENRFVQSPPPPPQAQHGYDYGPGWGHRGNKHYRKQGFGRLFFSS
jgi:Zn-finger nucleic acid-binding protein